jgi:hypothetical protein
MPPTSRPTAAHHHRIHHSSQPCVPQSLQSSMHARAPPVCGLPVSRRRSILVCRFAPLMAPFGAALPAIGLADVSDFG